MAVGVGGNSDKVNHIARDEHPLPTFLMYHCLIKVAHCQCVPKQVDLVP